MLSIILARASKALKTRKYHQTKRPNRDNIAPFVKQFAFYLPVLGIPDFCQLTACNQK